MLKYLHGEIYRILRKKSIYIYFGCFAAAYALIAIIRSGGATNGAILSEAQSLFVFLPAIVGGYLFAALYTDDLGGRNLTTLIGFGLSRTKIILSKLILTALFGGVIFGLLPLFMSGVYAIPGLAPTSSILRGVYIYVLHAFMLTFACTAVSAIVVYGLQRTTFGMVTYLLLSLGVVNQLLLLLFSWDVIRNLMPDLNNHIMYAISNRVTIGIMQGNGALSPIIEYIIYVTAATVLAVLAFHKKETEF